jgi:hypothetical protein
VTLTAASEIVGKKGTYEDAKAYNYEIWMLLETFRFQLGSMDTLVVDTRTRALKNAYLEAYLVHVRVLIAFFLAKPQKRNDISMHDFLPSPWIPTGTHVDRLKSVKPELDTRLAHLTRRRHDRFAGYPIPSSTRDLLRLHDEFENRIGGIGSKVGGWFREADAHIAAFRNAIPLLATDLAT